MATQILTNDPNPTTPLGFTDQLLDSDLELVYPYGNIAAQYRNKAWQTTGTPQWVFWETVNPDTTGSEFPGPGVFGTVTNYRVETIVYSGA